ncbi:MAG TPA: efflux RND transporter periplasmic adaptor subunit [Verrucomicrobiae bacterium]
MRAILHSRLAWMLVMVSAVAGCGRKPAPEPTPMAVLTVKAQAMERLRSVAEPGYIAIVRGENETDLSFKVPGIVELIGQGLGTNWNEGTPVKAGDLLAGLKQSDFTNALNSAQAEAELNTKVRDRLLKLKKDEAISQQEMDVAEAKWLTARAHLDQARQNLQDSRLRAPIDGVVLARYVNPGVTVSAGQRVLRFADFSTMSVELGVPDRLINYFSPGKQLEVEISALEGHPPFTGTVTEVGVAASQDGRLFRVVIKVPNPKGEIRSGMTATVRVGDVARFRPGSVSVPLSALVTGSAPERSGGPDSSALAVFVVRDGKALRRAVKTGDILNSSIIVTDGLEAGEEVVTAGASFLYDGAAVRVLPGLPAGNSAP